MHFRSQPEHEEGTLKVRISGITALVAGGASGLGLATAEHLVGGGASVVIADVSTELGVAAAERLGARANFVKTDITKPDDVARALDSTERFGPLRVVVNCAGVGSSVRTVGRKGAFPLEEFARVVQINLIGTFNVVRLAADRISTHAPIEGERGVIVNTASIAAFDGQVGQAAYSASKGGVVGMTLPIARDLAQLMIRVVTVAPGMFDTPLLGTLPHTVRSSLASQVPHPNRLGAPAEYGALVAHIVENAMINGETIRLDGALRMAPR
jgi:NAD(P)-dependent dehydrogenase (short-subunit alcohol dehydrogenase family)